VVSRHLQDIYKAGEVSRRATVAKNATVQREGDRSVKRWVEYFNLDAILSVGYRVNSRRGTQFRIWATHTLRDHLIQGYTLNERRLQEQGIEMQQAVQLLSRTLTSNKLVTDEGRGILDVIARYARSFEILRRYDENTLSVPAQGTLPRFILDASAARIAIEALRKDLHARGEATELFGQERGEQLEAIVGSIEQSFAGQPLYGSTEEKAAHLLYFLIKDHPFSDGNKRIGSFLFIRYLAGNGLLENDTGLPRISDNALVALALLTAESEPRNKELIIRLILNLLSDRIT
ncbi:MAG TPA: virulence protein RhuM/Fic/DOC family protein, partial [Gammaproteobacteria bacterium]|nr:virulence protein RhuM/Fic/DOC family protein [Gammaproteobacteria bacterium]